EDPTVKYNNVRQWWGEKDEGVIKTIVLAKQNGLSVMLKPHLWLKHGSYTGDFVLPDEKSWLLFETSYKNYVLHYAKICDSLQVDMFCIGIELGAAVKQRPDYFSKLIDDVKAIYKGKITYAANWDDYSRFPFWDKLDYIGIDAYFPLVNAASPTVAALQAAWKPHIAKMVALYKQVKKPIIFTEYGYRNTDSCTAEPWKETVRTTNNNAQATAYEALYKSVTNKVWFKGGFVWKWYADDYYKNTTRPDYTPQLKPAEAVIAKWHGKNNYD
ncbi:MAG: glycoside hydrolase TIM-barrel-like domain-containing protein, partial [Deinococcales bacterium]|nr:glycoside hydrolase TIM-barrel-like domain-containing protein [Chitinophagaceae bacterium]